ncbi:hypothetical protein [Micromonospora sp. NPDC050495]|uniref:hypothetical protein n=1 Tax=Micromonospora sp. NPDC050495 TaxID=3154936 RepID=UPI0033C67864
MKAPAEERGGTPHRAAPAPPRAAVDAEAATGVREPAERPLSRAAVQRLQAGAGNRAVAALVAQRRATAPRTPAAKRPASGAGRAAAGSVQRSAAPTAAASGPTTAGPASAPVTVPAGPDLGGPAAPVQRLATEAGPVQRPGPAADPKFAALKADVRGKQKLLAAHPPARSEAAKAQGAAKPPQDDKEAQGKAANAEKMNAAKPGEFDKAAFVRAVNEAIAAQAPKNLDEADKFGGSGKAEAVKGQVQGQVTDGKKASAGPIETTTKAPPDTSKAVEKPVTPLTADKPPGTPGTPDPAKAVPDKAPPEATDFSAGPKQVDQQMADAQVTEEQLARSNEPEFTGALKEKSAVEQHAATAPGQVRAAEARTLNGAKAAAGAAGAAAMTALATQRGKAGQSVGAGKEQAKSADEARRAAVTATLQKVFDATKKDVEDILSGLDKKVDEKFTTGEKAARDAFTAEHQRRMDEYKDRRYSGLLGKGRWLKDKFAGLPEEANQIFVTARKGYVDRMQQVISGVADLIGAELTRAKQRIAAGREQLQAEVKKLPADLRAIGQEAAGEFSGKFDDLTESVNNKGTELVQTLATKYNEALSAVDEEIAAEKEKNKGLVAKAVDAVAGVIKTILQLKDMLLGVLAKAAQAVMAIIKDPIGFLGNLVSAVGAGLRGFLANIGEHLKKGLVGWLTGAMAGAGLELPAKFDLRGIVMMIGSLLGLTWATIRGRIVQKGVPEPAMGAVEQSVPLVQKVQAQGLGGLWEEIQEKVGDLKANLFSKISEYLIPTILMAGITWIISLLNPASAFVRAVKMIIDFVSFIVNQGAQILEFVNSVLDAIVAIAGGGAGGVPALIEKALARSVPVLIGALAAILGIGGIAEKVKKFFQALSRPVMKAVDWVVGKIVGLGKKLWAKLRDRRGGRAAGGEPTTAREKERVARQAADDGYRAITQVPVSQVPGALDAVYARWQGRGVKRLEVVPLGNHEFTVEASVNPTTRSQKKASVDVPVPPEELRVEQVTATSFASSTTAASGSFSADSPAELTAILSSGASQRDLALTDSQQGAHAEEQVANHFHGSWERRRNEIVAALAARRRRTDIPLFEHVRMLMNVSKSSCINCASYIARFTRELRGSSSSVRVAMKFASLYKGAQEVPKSNMDDHGELIRLFVEQGQLKGTNRLGRLWGRMSVFGNRSERVTEVSGTYNAGKAGVAILRDAGIEVDVLDEDDVRGRGTPEQRTILERRNTRLKAALDEVDEKLKVRKG